MLYAHYTSSFSIAPSLGAMYGVFIAHRNVIYTHYTSACSNASSLGAAFNGTLPDSSFSATSVFDVVQNSAHFGRLNGPPIRLEGWAPKTKTNTPNEYLQIDLRTLYWICGVATQGDIGHGDSEWTTKYKISFSLDSITWNIFRWNGSDKVNTA